MKKNTFYFPHDYYARHDPKLAAFLKEHGPQGYGIYWAIIEILHEQNGKFRKFPAMYKGLSHELSIDEAVLKQCLAVLVHDFCLLQEDEEYIWSDRVSKNFIEREEIRQKKVEAGRKGGEKSGEIRKQNEAVLKQNEAVLEAGEANEAKESKVNKSKSKVNEKKSILSRARSNSDAVDTVDNSPTPTPTIPPFSGENQKHTYTSQDCYHIMVSTPFLEVFTLADKITASEKYKEIMDDRQWCNDCRNCKNIFIRIASNLDKAHTKKPINAPAGHYLIKTIQNYLNEQIDEAEVRRLRDGKIQGADD